MDVDIIRTFLIEKDAALDRAWIENAVKTIKTLNDFIYSLSLARLITTRSKPREMG